MSNWSLTFLIIGALTSYFDLLTYPLLSLGVPVILWLAFYYSDEVLRNIKHIVLLCVSWGIGYGGMWGLKWIIGDLLTDSNIISSAIKAIMFRTSTNLNEVYFSYRDVLIEQIKFSFQETWLIAVVAIIALFIVDFIIGKKIEILRLCIYAIVGAFPFIWYFVLQNHSYIHGKFTYRTLGISLFALVTYIVTNKAKNENILKNE